MVASGASWVRKREIFLACIPGSWKEGGVQNLNEDGDWGRQIPGSCKRGGAVGEGLLSPEQGGAVGSFSGGGSGALTPLDRAKKPAGAEGLAAGPWVGWGRVQAAEVPHRRACALTTLRSRPRRGLARCRCGAGPGGG